ncbi:segregation/condensation protein A [Acetobacteraceae bacterium]|nr:segregation/condensation protein A [Candidatus Parcubacteria bacterium]
MPITVKTPIYEGPLDLLLDLIEKRRLLINDISLASVTDEYIARINNMSSMPVGETAEFIALASTLLLIKSRSLLPNLEISGEEERDIKELEYRLALFALIKEGAKGLHASRSLPMLHEGILPEREPLFVWDSAISLQSLQGSARTLIEGFPQTLTLPRVEVKKTVSLEEMIDHLSQRVARAMTLSFKEFSGLGQRARPEVIVSFLALLELVKQGIIKASQTDDFGDITLESDSVSTPSYE